MILIINIRSNSIHICKVNDTYTPLFIGKQVPLLLDFLGWELILSGPQVDCTKGYRGLRRDVVYISHGQSSCLNKSIQNKNTNVDVVQMTSHPSREYWRP